MIKGQTAKIIQHALLLFPNILVGLHSNKCPREKFESTGHCSWPGVTLLYWFCTYVSKEWPKEMFTGIGEWGDLSFVGLTEYICRKQSLNKEVIPINHHKLGKYSLFSVMLVVTSAFSQPNVLAKFSLWPMHLRESWLKEFNLQPINSFPLCEVNRPQVSVKTSFWPSECSDFKNSANHFWLIYIMLDIQSFKYN